MSEELSVGDAVLEQTVAEVKAIKGQLFRAWFGRVAATSPPSVFLDGDFDENDDPIATPVFSMVSALAVGDLVFCVEQDRRVTIIAAQS